MGRCCAQRRTNSATRCYKSTGLLARKQKLARSVPVSALNNHECEWTRTRGSYALESCCEVLHPATPLVARHYIGTVTHDPLLIHKRSRAHRCRGNTSPVHCATTGIPYNDAATTNATWHNTVGTAAVEHGHKWTAQATLVRNNPSLTPMPPPARHYIGTSAYDPGYQS